MKGIAGKEILVRIDRYLADPRLDTEAQLRKRWVWIWFLVTFVFVTISAIIEFFVFKLWPMWWFGAIFMTGYLIGFPLFRRVKRFDLVINVIFSVYTIAAMFAMLQAGGLTTSMGFIFIGMNCAMGSVLTGNLRWTIGMFILYCITIIIIGIFQSSLTTPTFITPRINTLSFVILAVWINACILFIVILFMKDKSRYEKSEAEKLRKIDEIKTKLFTNVSHEFRTPLTVIKGIAEQMEQEPNRWMQSGPGKIKTQSGILLRLINQMLDVAKIEADEMQLELIQGDIRKFIQNIAGTFQSFAENRKIELILNEQEGTIYTDYDPDKLMQVISNLLSNAIKFTPPGGVVTIDIKASQVQNKETILITVQDTGRGIPKASLNKIFERFYQVPDNYDQTPGTGLGLAITYELIKLMKGEIRVESEEGKGTLFTVLLPASRVAEKAIDHGISIIRRGNEQTEFTRTKDSEKIVVPNDETTKKPVLLVVEDNKDVVEYLQAVLEKHYEVETAFNGKAGLKKAREIIPDIILSDVMMPMMDGFEMLEKLKIDFRTDHIPVVILTARGDFDSRLTGLEIGADHYLIKPFNEKELFLKLRNLLKLRRTMQKHFGKTPFQMQEDENTPYKTESKFIKSINTLIEKQMGNEDFGINEICLSMNMSRAQLYRKFSAITNTSIGHYLRSYRLHKAKFLLENQGKNVTEAAFESGFKNLSYFSTCFHEEFGIAPNKLIHI